MIADFQSLWQHVTRHCVPKNALSPHGPDHWRRVERNGLILSTRTRANTTVVRLFALFHDCQRINDCGDPEHGARAAAYASSLRGKAFDLPEDDFELLRYACTWHTEGHQNDDATIGTCWDADRLDLGRVGAIPDPDYMSTEFAAEIARYGTIIPWVHLAPADLNV